MPTCVAARPTPGASYIVSSMSAARRARSSSNRSIGRVRSRRTGSPNTLMGRTATLSSLHSQMRLRLDPRDHTVGRELSRQDTERGDATGLEREQAYRLLRRVRDEQRDRLDRAERLDQL